MALPGSTNKTKYLTIKAGESGVLKANVKILSVVATGSAQADSTCITLPTPEPQACFSIQWAVDTDSNEAGAWDTNDNNLALVGIGIGDTFFESPNYINAGGGLTTFPTFISDLKDFIEAEIPEGLLKYYEHSVQSTTGDRSVRQLIFQAAASIGPTVYIKWEGTGIPNGAFIYASECADCCEGSAE